MRKLYTIIVGIFLILSFTTCTQFTAHIDEYLSYWSTEVSAVDYNINKPSTKNGDALCIPSTEDVTVTIKLNNPKSLKLVMPKTSADAEKVIRFQGLPTQPKYEADYTLEQGPHDTLTLVYKKNFLQRYEWGSGDISPEITFIADDSRVFRRKFTMNLSANTPPPKPTFTVAKTTGTPSYYVLCITVPEDKTVSGRLLHKDINCININGKPYSLSVDETQTAFTKPASDKFITQSNVEKLNATDELPPGGLVLYYKTDAEVKDGAAKKDYTITLADEKGLVSGELKASTKPNRPAPVHINLVKGLCTADVNNDNTGTAPHTIAVGGQNKPATLRLTSATANATIHYTLTETSAGSTASPSNGSGAGSGLDIPLPIQTGKTEAKYTLTAWVEADGFETGTTRTVYYKIIAQSTDTALNELKLTEGSDVYSADLIEGSDSAYICKILFTGAARTLNLTAKTANDQSKITAVTVNGTTPAGFVAANTVTLVNAVTLPDSLPAQAVVKITVTGEDTSATKEYTLTVTAIDPPVLNSLAFSSGGTPVQFSNAADTGNEAFSTNTLEYYIFAAQLSPSSLSFTATPEADAAVTVKVNGSDHTGTTVTIPTVGGETLVTFTVEKAGLQNEYKVHIKRKAYTVTLMAKSSDDESAAGGGTINVTNATGAGIGSVTGNSSATVTVKAESGATITVTVMAASGCTFIQWSKDGTQISTTPSLSYVVGSNAEIKAEFKSPNIYVRGTNGDWYSNTTNVPGGAAEGNDDTGTGSKQKPYKTVSKALSQCTETGTPYTIFVDGTINETVTLNIPSGKTVTIESLRKDTPAVIEEKRVSPSAYQYLLTTAGTLTLDSVILKANKTGTHTPDANTFICGIQQNGGTVTVKGNTTEIRNFAHAVEVKGGTFTMEGGSICNNYINGGSAGVTIEGGGTFKLTGGSIKNNEATSMAGVYVKGSSATNQGIFKMESGEISGNKAKCLGGGIYVGEHGQADISGGTIKANHAAQITYQSPVEDVGGGGIYVEKGTVNFTAGTIEGNIIHEVEKNCGAGVFIGKNGTFNMSGGTIKDCTTQSSAFRPSRGIGVYVAGGAAATKGTFNMTGGTIENCKPLAAHAADGGGVYVGAGAVFTMKKYARVTPSTGSEANGKGKNDIYLANGAKITINEKLESSAVARITPQSYPTSSNPTIQVLQNPTGNTTNVAENYFKFTVTSDSNTNTAYCVNEAGLIRQQVDTTPYDENRQNWAKLKAAIESAGTNTVIYVRDVCYANNANDTITVDKTITLIGLTSGHVSLDANQKCRIFTIKNGGKLTIKNMELEKGQASDGKGGGGILLENDSSNKSLTLENVSITSCYTSGNGTKHGAGIAIYKGTVTMKGKTQISDCKSLVYGCWGGGVYIGAGGTLTIDGYNTTDNNNKTYIRLCEATKGGGVYIASGGKLELKQGQLSLNRVKDTPKKGIAVYNENTSASSFEWSGGAIKYHYVGSGGTVIEGPCNNTSGNTAD